MLVEMKTKHLDGCPRNIAADGAVVPRIDGVRKEQDCTLGLPQRMVTEVNKSEGLQSILSLSSITCACAPSFLLTHPFLVLQPSTPISCHLSKPTLQASLPPPPPLFFNSSSASYHCYALAYLVAVLHRQMILLRNRVIGLGGAVECNVLCYLPALGLRHFTCDL